MTVSLKESYEAFCEKFVKACQKAQRNPKDLCLIAVTKTHPYKIIQELLDLGHKDFGENYFQEFEEKFKTHQESSTQPAVWHLIGPLQTKKIKGAITLMDSYHACSSLKNFQELLKNAHLRASLSQPLEFFIQINTSEEPSKSGFSLSDLDSLEPYLQEIPKELLLWRGFMTIPASLSEVGPEKVRQEMASLRKLRDQWQKKVSHPLGLSMGMSEDFEIALEEGATHLRIGRALLGNRNVSTT